jgi:hypothetical protein
MHSGSDRHEHPPAEYSSPEDIRRLFERYRAPRRPAREPRFESSPRRGEETEKVPALAGR